MAIIFGGREIGALRLTSDKAILFFLSVCRDLAFSIELRPSSKKPSISLGIDGSFSKATIPPSSIDPIKDFESFS